MEPTTSSMPAQAAPAMPQVPSSSTPVSTAPFNGHSLKIVFSLGILLLAIIGIWIASRYLLPKTQITDTSPQGQQILEKLAMKPADYKPGSYEAYIASLDQAAANPDYSSDLQSHLLIKKGLMLLDAEETDPQVQSKNRAQANDIFRSVYEKPVVTSNDAFYKEISIEYLLLSYARTLFAVENTNQLPASYISDYQKAATASYATSNDKVRTLQKESLKAYIGLANDPSLSVMSHDKVMVAMRLFTTASYLDGFYNEIIPTERQQLVDQLKKDVAEYPNTRGIAFIDVRYTKLIADFYYAYAYDVLAARSPVGAFAESDVVANYEKARANVDTKSDYLHTYGVYGSYIDMYYLAHLAKLDVKDPAIKTKVDQLVAEMNSYTSLAASIKQSTAGLFAYLNGRGSWSGVRARLDSFSAKNEAYKAFSSDMRATYTASTAAAVQ
jgi:hypothetical protein